MLVIGCACEFIDSTDSRRNHATVADPEFTAKLEFTSGTNVDIFSEAKFVSFADEAGLAPKNLLGNAAVARKDWPSNKKSRLDTPMGLVSWMCCTESS